MPMTVPAGAAAEPTPDAGPRLRGFLVVFSGQLLSLFGSELVQFALVFWLTQASGSASTLAVAAIVGLLPPVVLGPLVGALVDRWDRRIVMAAADAAIAAATLALAALFALGLARVEHVYAAMLVRALGSTFHWPAMQASTTLMVPARHLARVAGAAQALRGIAGVSMPPLAAVLLVSLSLPAILLIDVATALLAMAPLLVVDVPSPVRAASERGALVRSFWRDLAAGARFAWEWRGLAALIGLVSVLHFWAAPAFALTPVVATRVFARGAGGLAWIQSATGAGFLAGGVLLATWGGFRRRIVTVLLGISILGIALATIGALPTSAFAAVVGAVFAAGAAAPLAVGSFQAIQQAVVPPELQGRVSSLARSGMDAMSPIGLAVAGPVADAFGLQRWYLLTGAVMVLMAGAALLVPAVMDLERAGEEARRRAAPGAA
jgi:DHA3 family macrolide efflux protein-like MFS transporter